MYCLMVKLSVFQAVPNVCTGSNPASATLTFTKSSDGYAVSSGRPTNTKASDGYTVGTSSGRRGGTRSL